MIKARNVDPASAIRYSELMLAIASGTAASVTHTIGAWPFSQNVKTQTPGTVLPQFAKIVDVVLSMPTLPTGATSVSFNVLKNGTTIFTTNGAFATTTGVLDAKAEIALVSGATRPVLKTDATVLLKKGDILTFTLTLGGTVTVSQDIGVQVIIDPSPV